MPFPNLYPFDNHPQFKDASSRPLRVGTGRAIAHHGELLQGVFPDGGGRLHRGLITLPFPRIESVVTFWPDDGNEIHTRQKDRTKAARAAALTFQKLGHSYARGCLTIETSIPVGCGYGSSTADVIAAIRAATAAVGAELHRSVICQLAVAAETASDAVVFDEQAVLFAHREGRVLEYFPGDYPPLYVVGFTSRDDAPIDTLAFAAARYDSAEIENFRVLRGLFRRAVHERDAVLLGHVATASARINQRFLPKRHFDALQQISRDLGGCGVQVAHSGNLMGILIDPKEPDAAARTTAIAMAARGYGFSDIVRFSVNVDGMPLWS